MGAAQSGPRSVSMDNPTPAGVIDVSDEVVQRLKKGISKQAKESAAATPAPAAVPVTTASAKPAAKEAQQSVAKAPTPAIKSSPAAPVVVQQPIYTYVTQPGTTITALDMRRQKEQELQQNDAMWRQRMTQLEQTLNKTNIVMEKEYSAAVDDVRQRFKTAAPSHQLPPCQDLKAQIIACYRAHPGETLKCAEEVAMFRNCVSANRVKKLEPQPPAKGA